MVVGMETVLKYCHIAGFVAVRHFGQPGSNSLLRICRRLCKEKDDDSGKTSIEKKEVF